MGERAVSIQPVQAAQMPAMLTHVDPQVRLSALAAMVESPAHAKHFFHLIVDDTHPAVRTRLVQVALLLQAQISAEVMARLLTTELKSHVHKRRFKAVGLLHFLTTVDVGYFLARCAKDTQLATRKSVLETMCARLGEISQADIDRIVRSQLQSDNWEHRLLGLTCLAKEPRLLRGAYLVLCAREMQPKCHELLIALVQRCASTLSRAEVEAVMTPELLSREWKQRMNAVKMLRMFDTGSVKSLLQLASKDSVAAVRDMARRAQQAP